MSKMPLVLTYERQKMSVEMWEKLKSHIMKQREKRKQEQEQDAEQERHRREQELKRKRDATTLEDIKDQLGKLESKLTELKEEKHALFLQLKKVLNEDSVRKEQKESEIIAAHMAFHAQQQIGHSTQYNPYYLANTSSYTNSRIQPTLQHAQLQQNQLYQKVSPISTGGSLPTPPSLINSVITQSSSLSNQQQQSGNKRVSIKRPHERSPSPQPNVPYTGILPVYKTSMAYTPSITRAVTSNQQLYYPQTAQLSVVAGQPTGVPNQLNFDAKTNPYHFLPANLASVDSVSMEQLNNNSANNQPSLSQQQLNQIQQQQDYYNQHLRGIANLHGSSLIPIQAGQVKPGGISAGFPLQRNSGQVNTSTASNSAAIQAQNRQFSQRYMY